MAMKKVLLLSCLALALIAFAAPAVAQAEAFWTTTDGTVGGAEESVIVESEGELATFSAGFNTNFLIRLEGEVRNGASDGEGSIEAEASEGFVSGIPKAICAIEVIPVGEPWSVTLTTDKGDGAETDDATLDIEEMGLFFDFSHGCHTVSGGFIPKESAITGTMKATAATNGDTTNLALEPTQSLYLTDPTTWQHITTVLHFGFSSNPSPLVLQTVDPEGSIGVEQHE
jgi:hypothetical protein